MPSPTAFQPISLDIPKPTRKPGRPNKHRNKQRAPFGMTALRACVSQAILDRLIAEAMIHPAFQGMGPDELRAYVNTRLDEFLRSYPRWSGNLPSDRPKKPASEAQREALAKARRRKAQIQSEAESPYVIKCEREQPYHGANRADE